MKAPHRNPVHRLATRLFLQGALVALVMTLGVGLLAALYSSPTGAALLEPLGVDMRDLRPLHTVFGAAWIILGALAVVFRDLQDRVAQPSRGERRRLRLVVLSFAAAGLGIGVTVPLGITSGREYVGFHPVFSAFIAFGWGLLCWSWFRVHWRGRWGQPVYRIMWGTGLVLFLWTLAEQYAWLLPGVFADPIVDRRLQWKACGSLVGAFNFLVYGGLVWVGSRLSGERDYAYSRVAWGLWVVSAANTLLNYLHHTYHLPQGQGLNWWGFLVSMTEFVLLMRAVSDVLALARTRQHVTSATRHLLAATQGWTLFMLATSIVISIPPLNALVHGTYLIVGHAMGGMLGIDTMAVLALVCFLLGEDEPSAGPVLEARSTIHWVWLTNAAVAGMVLWLHGLGAIDGVLRYLAGGGGGFAHRPAWLQATLPIGLVVSGSVSVLGFGVLLRRLIPLAWPRGPVWSRTR